MIAVLSYPPSSSPLMAAAVFVAPGYSSFFARTTDLDTGSQHRFSVIFWTFLNTTRLSINLKKEATWVFYRATMFNAHYDLARTVFERLAIPWSTCHSVICIIFLACFMEPGRFLRGLVWRSNDVYLLSYGYCYFLLLAFLDVGAAQQRSDLLQCYTYACVTVVAPYVPLV